MCGVTATRARGPAFREWYVSLGMFVAFRPHGTFLCAKGSKVAEFILAELREPTVLSRWGCVSVLNAKNLIARNHTVPTNRVLLCDLTAAAAGQSFLIIRASFCGRASQGLPQRNCCRGSGELPRPSRLRRRQYLFYAVALPSAVLRAAVTGFPTHESRCLTAKALIHKITWKAVSGSSTFKSRPERHSAALYFMHARLNERILKCMLTQTSPVGSTHTRWWFRCEEAPVRCAAGK